MIFELSWSWYEEYNPYLFEGPEVSKDEWNELCKKVLVSCFDEYMTESVKGWACLPDWIEFAVPKMAMQGYKQIKPVSCAFWGCFLPRTDKLREEEKEMPEFIDQIATMKKYNDKMDKELYERQP